MDTAAICTETTGSAMTEAKVEMESPPPQTTIPAPNLRRFKALQWEEEWRASTTPPHSHIPSTDLAYHRPGVNRQFGTSLDFQ